MLSLTFSLFSLICLFVLETKEKVERLREEVCC